MTTADVFLAHGRTLAEKPALRADGRSWSFGELAAEAAKTANAMAALGIGAQDRVGITTRRGSTCVLESIALWMLGATVVPLDFRMPPAEVARIAEEFSLSTVFADRALCLSGRQEIVRDGAWVAAIEAASPLPPEAPAEPGLAILSLTSGTTGRPIGIALTHTQFVLRTSQYGRVAVGRNPIFACAGLMSFSAVRNHTFGQLLAGNTVIFYPPMMDASEFIERLRADRATNTFTVPTTARAMLTEAAGASSPVLPDMSCLYTGGADMSAEDKLAAHRLLTPGFLLCFSSSITGTCSILTGDDLLAQPDTDGRLLDGVRVEIVDSADRPLPDGEIGHMRVRSVAMASQLIGGAGREAGDKLKGGWAYTGDLASVSGNFLSIRGRSGDFIVRGGANVYPSEIEHAVMSLSGVRECAAVGFASEREGQEIAAFVAGEGLSEDMLVRHCREHLSPDKRPRRIIFVEALPRNANGKVLRKELVVE
ncbi:acyl--CoA ligase [Vannielia litorea]|uniref:class I adenylate-forming enzyme family protein n=1 Tax=Vannielia litorea TaxID=1217970 RepID=UPI001C9544A9|nr:class I adenylate-forming enzyme family protein [Vannielia litorea]MBY6153797.1 acyl--CoA ligase [Vannielia litorea]